jgi:hypothetical protein
MIDREAATNEAGAVAERANAARLFDEASGVQTLVRLPLGKPHPLDYLIQPLHDQRLDLH